MEKTMGLSKIIPWFKAIGTKIICLAFVGMAYLENKVLSFADDGLWSSAKDQEVDAETGSGIGQIFDQIGGFYIKYAWFFGIAGALIWFLGDERKAPVGKKILIGVIIGYAIFGAGPAIVGGAFNLFKGAFA